MFQARRQYKTTSPPLSSERSLMATYPNSRLHNLKRQHTEAGLSQDDLPSLPSKKFKPTREPHSSSSLPLPAFWDNLSKIWLTRQALKELGRRNAQSNRSPTQYKIRKPRTRSAVHKLEQKAQATPVFEYLLRASQADITLLKSFARQGGPDITDLRGYTRHTMSSSRSSSKRRRSTDPSSANSKSKKSTTAYDRGFEQNLIDHGVYLNNRAQTPDNSEEINKRLANPRPSLSPSKFSEAAFKAFRASDFRAKDEDDVMIDVVPVISGMHQDNHFSARKTKFGNLDPLTDGTIAPANPDLFYGARPEQLDRRIRDKLSGRIIPSTMEDKPMAPNFYFEAKGPDGSAAVARRQACYDGAIGARALQSLQSYGQDGPIYDNKAYTISSIYHNGQLQMYTTHITPPAGPGKPPEYQMTQINTWGLTGNAEAFRQGATAFRNGRDLAEEWRDGFISTANERVGSLNAEPSTLKSSNYSRPLDLVEDSETSADELALTSTSISYPVEESKNSTDELFFPSFSHPVDDEFSDDELSLTTDAKPTGCKKRPVTELKNFSKDQRSDTYRRGRHPRIRTLRLIEGNDVT